MRASSARIFFRSVAEARRINDAIRWKRGARSVGRIVGRWIKNGTRQASKIPVANSGSWNLSSRRNCLSWCAFPGSHANQNVLFLINRTTPAAPPNWLFTKFGRRRLLDAVLQIKEISGIESRIAMKLRMTCP